MFEMDLFPWGATVALWILPILFTMYTWRRPWAEALERTVRYHFIASAIYLGIGVFSGAEGIVAYGSTGSSPLPSWVRPCSFATPPRTEIAMDSNTDTGPTCQQRQAGDLSFRNRG